MRKCIGVGLFVAFLAASVLADVPHVVNYQGKLADKNSKPVNATVSMTFGLYYVSAGGASAFTETQNVIVTNGIYSVLIGSATAGGVPTSIFSAGADVYLNIVVAGETLTPRQRIATVPYALKANESDSAANADRVDGMDSTSFAAASHTHTLGSITTASEILNSVKTVDGSGSGLDADLLDGLHSTSFSFSSHTHTLSSITTAAEILTNVKTVDGAGSGLDADLLDGLSSASFATSTHSHAAADLLTSIKSVDGSGSGLDADLLDGLDSTQFLRSDTSGTLDGKLTVTKAIDTTGTSGYQVILPGGIITTRPGTAALKATGTSGGLFAPGAPAIDAVGGGGTLLGSADIALRAFGKVYLLNHDDPSHGIYLIPGDGTSDYACDMGLYGTTGEVYPGIRFQFDTEYASGKGPIFTTNSGSQWQLYGNNASGSSALKLSGPSSGEFILDWPNGTIQLGGSTADTVEIPAIIDGGIYVNRDASGGVSASTIRAYNTNAGGIALLGSVTSTDACTVFANKGTGDIIRGFSGATGGNLVFRVLNSGRVVCTELEITGGADLAEPFDVSGDVKPGMVVSIDSNETGRLLASRTPYDTNVAGVISGANGVKPGVTMKQEGTSADGSHPVALSGRVYCWCDASTGAIRPGDLLTTSSTPGHAMKAADRNHANGAILGKAMQSLPKGGKGLILVLLALQ